jgi:hypothetical protein
MERACMPLFISLASKVYTILCLSTKLIPSKQEAIILTLKWLSVESDPCIPACPVQKRERERESEREGERGRERERDWERERERERVREGGRERVWERERGREREGERERVSDTGLTNIAMYD